MDFLKAGMSKCRRPVIEHAHDGHLIMKGHAAHAPRAFRPMVEVRVAAEGFDQLCL